MPGTLLGLVLFVASVVPGYVYVRVAERRTPRPERSRLVEAAELVFVGSLSTSIAAMLVLYFGSRWHALDLQKLRHDPTTYLLSSPVRVLGAAGITLMLSYCGAFLSARAIHLGRPASFRHSSAWSEVLGRSKGKTIAFATVEYGTGWTFAGQVLTYRADADAEHKELVLRQPIHARRPRGQSQKLDERYIVLPSENLVYLSVKYRPAPQTQRWERLRAFLVGRHDRVH